MPPIRIELLGRLRFTFGQELLTTVNTNRLQSLLAFLVLHADSVQSREHLAFRLWPESNESQARTNLRQLVHHLRRALPVECSLLVTDNHTVCWRLDSSCTIDVIEFETSAVRAAGAEKKGDFASAREALENAARLYQDDLLPDLYDDWLQSRREELRQQLVEVLGRLTALLDTAGEYPAAIRHATRLVALDPLREPSYQSLIRLHIRNNDRSSALRVYHQCMRTLRRELGITPGKATQDLFAQALKADAMPAAPVELPPSASTAPMPLVGRAKEWEGLLSCWQRVTQGEMHFALIQGEAGIGKSRLAEELYQFRSRNPEGAAARSRCYSAQGQLAYGPVAEWLRAEPMRQVRAQLPRPQLAELARALPEILVENPDITHPQPLTEGWQRRHFYDALNAGFVKCPKPLLLLIDDLQWCDHDTFEWMHSFFRSDASGGILVLGTVRPEELGRDHPLHGLAAELRQTAQLSEFPLAALGPDESATLATQTARRDCDPEFLSRLYNATKGHPLFLVESVRAALEDHPTTSAAPPRVQAVISERLARLSPPAYELAGLGAAIGRPFSFDLLAKSTDWDENSLSRALEELWQRRIIDGQGSGTYDFTHDLLRDVAYAELNPIRRRSWHRRVARGIEEIYERDVEGVSGWLAAHYAAAGMAEQAIGNYRIAASLAKCRFADTEAAELIRRALQLCREFPETAKRDKEELELLVTLGPSLVTTHGYSIPEVETTYERGLALAQRLGDRTHLFLLLSGAWAFNVVGAQLEKSRRLGQRCIDEQSNGGDMVLERAGHFLVGCSLFHLGQLSASLEHIERALLAGNSPSHPDLALFAGPDIRVTCRSYLAHLRWQFGDASDAIAKCEEAIALARELSNPFCLAIALDYAALLDVFRQDAAQTVLRATEACEVCSKHGFAYYLAWGEILAGWGIAVGGDITVGLGKLRHGIAALQATGAELRLPCYYGLLAEACGLAGQTGEALANIANGFAFQNKNGEVWFAPELHRIHGDLLLRTGDISGARTNYRRAIETARQTGARLFELRAESRLNGLPGPEETRQKAPERQTGRVQNA